MNQPPPRGYPQQGEPDPPERIEENTPVPKPATAPSLQIVITTFNSLVRTKSRLDPDDFEFKIRPVAETSSSEEERGHDPDAELVLTQTRNVDLFPYGIVSASGHWLLIPLQASGAQYSSGALSKLFAFRTATSDLRDWTISAMLEPAEVQQRGSEWVVREKGILELRERQN
jgi:hypothetical protein